MASSNNHRILSTGTALGFLPLALVQSARLRSDTLATPLPVGDPHGAVGDLSAPAMDLLVVGDSSAVGGCCEDMDAALPPRLAYGVAMRLRRGVRWTARGGAGWTAAQLDNVLRREGVPAADVALVLLGVNDAVALTPRASWRRQMKRIVGRLFDAGARLVVVSGVPRLERLPGLAWPLGPLLGLRGRQLDRVARELARSRRPDGERDLVYAPVPAVDPQAHLAGDGVHASAAGYAWWAACLADVLAREYAQLPAPPTTAVDRTAVAGV
ncbi:MAG: SGNH/GDSL hydrolase family protein [Pseudomonadales bacterium]|nr:SGNH/GDSL hydrolase family protein [Pseudomonadales bacterium]